MALGRSGLGFLISENKDSQGDIIKLLQEGNDEGERKTLQLEWAGREERATEPDSLHLQRSQQAFTPMGLL